MKQIKVTNITVDILRRTKVHVVETDTKMRCLNKSIMCAKGTKLNLPETGSVWKSMSALQRYMEGTDE